MSLRRLNDNSAYTPLGAFRDQITLLAQSDQRALDGSYAPMVVFASAVWANIRTMKTPQEIDHPENVQGEAFYEVRIPYIENATSQVIAIQLESGKVWFVIAIVDKDHRKRELSMTCRSINDGVTITTPIGNQVYVPASSGNFDIDDGTFGPDAQESSWEFGSGD
jgi:head-tail adaptor